MDGPRGLRRRRACCSGVESWVGPEETLGSDEGGLASARRRRAKATGELAWALGAPTPCCDTDEFFFEFHGLSSIQAGPTPGATAYRT